MKVILLEDIEMLGKAGEMVTVSEGYARNLLFPQGKAAQATQQTEKKVAAQKAQEKAQADEKLAALQQKAESLTGTELTLIAKRREGEEIFGSISVAQVVKELNAQAGLDLKPKDISLQKAITKLGSQDVVIHLSPEVETSIKVTIISDAKE